MDLPLVLEAGELTGYSRWLGFGQLLGLVIAWDFGVVLIGFPSCENYVLVSETALPPRSGMLKGAASNALR